MKKYAPNSMGLESIKCDRAYAASRQQALACLKPDYGAGGERPLDRDEVHGRDNLR